MHIIFFDQPGADDSSTCGGKAASLGRLGSLANVPAGFCVTVNAFLTWRNAGSNAVPDLLVNEIRQAYSRLEEISGEPSVPVAVRSSAVDEDGAEESFAGLHDTFLNISGADAVLAAVVNCWRSLGNERAIEYRQNKGVGPDESLMGVAVQQLVLADISAVAFSANPINGDRSEIVINANYGLGEAVVSGATTPDTITLKKDDLAQQNLIIGSKEVMTVRTQHGTEEKSVPRIMRNVSSIKPAQAEKIAALANQLEEFHGWPVDIECAIKGDELYLLQCRPITTL